LSTDNGLSSLDFIGDSDYKRRVHRGQSTCFECLDQKDIVLQVAPQKTRNEIALPSGESVVYVPLLASAGGIGVIEIHGLRTPGVTDTKNFERSPDLLRALISAKDYSFMNHTRLWRLPGSRSGGEVSELDKKDYSLAAYSVVQGKVVDVVTELNGVPFFGGARFNILWEDGLMENAVVAADLVAVYRHTPQSLGVTSLLTEELATDLLDYAGKAAILIESQRTVEALKRTQDSVNIPNLRDMDLAERCLGSMVGVVPGAREANLIGLEKVNLAHIDHNDPVHANTKPFIISLLQKKTPKARVITRGLQKNSRSVTEEYVLERMALEQGVNPNKKNSKKKRNLFSDKTQSTEEREILIALQEKAKSPLSIIPDADPNDQQKKSLERIDWIVIELQLPNYYHWSAKPTCSRFFVVVLKARNPNHQGNMGEVNSLHALTNILEKALTVRKYTNYKIQLEFLSLPRFLSLY
jgi:hypothetical protein